MGREREQQRSRAGAELGRERGSVPPMMNACVPSEKSVAQTTKPIASGPAFSWTHFENPLRCAAESGSELPP